MTIENTTIALPSRITERAGFVAPVYATVEAYNLMTDLTSPGPVLLDMQSRPMTQILGAIQLHIIANHLPADEWAPVTIELWNETSEKLEPVEIFLKVEMLRNPANPEFTLTIGV